MRRLSRYRDKFRKRSCNEIILTLYYTREASITRQKSTLVNTSNLKSPNEEWNVEVK